MKKKLITDFGNKTAKMNIRCKATNRVYFTYDSYRQYDSYWKSVEEIFFMYHEKECAFCGNLNVKLFHKTFKNLGNETVNDLIPLCFNCGNKHFDKLRTAYWRGRRKQSKKKKPTKREKKEASVYVEEDYSAYEMKRRYGTRSIKGINRSI